MKELEKVRVNNVLLDLSGLVLCVVLYMKEQYFQTAKILKMLLPLVLIQRCH